MADQARVRVHYEDAYSDYRADVEVVGDRNETFRRAFLERIEANPQNSRYFVLVYGPDEFDRVALTLDSDVTLGAVAEVFESETVHIDNGGRGGGGGWESLGAAVAQVVPFGKAALASLKVYGALRSIHYRAEREAIKDWDDTGVVSMELRQMVLRENRWQRSVFNGVFGLSRDRGSALLRELGYWRWGTLGGAEYWACVEDDEWMLPPDPE